MFTAIIPILCNINLCMLFLLSIEKKKTQKYLTSPFCHSRCSLDQPHARRTE